MIRRDITLNLLPAKGRGNSCRSIATGTVTMERIRDSYRVQRRIAGATPMQARLYVLAIYFIPWEVKS